MCYKKLISIILCFALFFLFYGKTSANSGAFLVMDGRDGTILESENSNQKLPMASTTKIMTALVVLKNSKLDDQVKITPESVGVEGSSLYIKSDEIYTVEELLYGLMLRSANDCAEALAHHVGEGSREKFIEKMNREAAQMGLKNTSFANPSGLPEENHYTTAVELALIMKKAMENSDFRKIVATKHYKIKGNSIANHNRLLSLYDGCIGGKTGYTMEAGRCLVSVAERQGVPLICVTLGRRDDWNIHSNSYDKWFAQLKEVIFLEPYDFSVSLKTPYGSSVEAVNADRVSAFVFEGKSDIERLVYAQPLTYGNKEKGAVAGTIYFCSGDTVLGESTLVLNEEIIIPIEKDLFISRIFRFFRRLFLKNS